MSAQVKQSVYCLPQKAEADSRKTESKRHTYGFTLVELLVVVAIIGVLSTIGITVFTGARNSAQQAKIKADLDTIRKAYDASYDPINDSYRPLQASDFSNGEIPKKPSGDSYLTTAVKGPESTNNTTNKAYAICTLTGNSTSGTCSIPSDICYCISSTQGQGAISSSTGNTSSCDPFNTLTGTGSNLVGWWKFNVINAGTIADDSGNNNNLTIANGATLTSSLNQTFDKALLLNAGSNQFAYKLTPSNLPLSNSARTLAVWFKPASFSDSTYNGLISYGSRQCSGMAQLLSVQNNQRLSSANWCNDLNQLTSNNTLFPMNDWSLAVFTYDGTTKILYLNKTVVAQTTPTAGSINTGAGTLAIGSTDYSSPTVGGRYFYGAIDEARIYTKALSPAEIEALYNNGAGCTY